MKTLKVLAVLSIAASTALAVPESGFFVGVEAGRARLKNSDFKVFNPIASPSPEALHSQDNTNNVAVMRLSAGYAFTREWALQLSYASFGEGEINFPGPRYPGMFFVTAPDDYVRNAVIFRTNAVTLLPVYSISLGKALRVSGGLGLNYATTRSHFEMTRVTYLPRSTTALELAEDTEHDWGLAVQFGCEYFLFDNLSLAVTANYQEAKAKVPVGWARSATTFEVKTTSVLAAVAWHF